MLRDVTDADFDDRVLASARPVLIDFWADWCAPCHALAPTLADMAVEFDDLVDVAKVDIIANPRIADQFGVRSIPLLVMMRDGKEVARTAGGLSRTRLAAFIEDNAGASV